MIIDKLSESTKYLAGKTDPENTSLWLPLWMHLRDTAQIMEYLVDLWLPDSVKRSINLSEDKLRGLACFLGGVHDLGKATVCFQANIMRHLPDAQVRLQRCSTLQCSEQNRRQSPHARTGEAILIENACPAGIASIVGSHHGKTQSSERVDEQFEAWSANLFPKREERFWTGTWEEMIAAALCESAEYEDICQLPDMLTQSDELLLTGLLTMADWIASNTEYFPLIPVEELGSEDLYPDRVDTAWDKLKLSMPWEAQADVAGDAGFEARFGFAPNDMQKEVVSIANEMSTPGLLIIEAQMGSGKTEAALAAAEILAAHFGCGGIFFGLPTQATANGIFPRLVSWAQTQTDEICHSIRLAHGMAELNEDYIKLQEDVPHIDDDSEQGDENIMVHQWFRGKRQALLADFVIGTVDQLLMAALRQKYVMLRHLGLAGKVVIIDEVHAYDAYMNQYLDRTLQWLGWYKVPVILLSATLPAKRRAELVDAYIGNGDTVHERIFSSDGGYPVFTWTDRSSVEQKSLRTNKKMQDIHIEKITEDDMAEMLRDKLRNGGCAGVIVNTVRKAQDISERLREALPDKEILLFHSQFLMPDRSAREDMLMQRIGRRSTRTTRDGLVVVGTQVLEQSLDIDFDVMITELCPMDLLLQRVGRLHRHDRNRPKALQEAVCAVLDTGEAAFDRGSSAVYGEWLLWRTRALIPDVVSLPDDIPKLVQKTYGWEQGDVLCIPDDIQLLREEYERNKAISRQKAEAYRVLPPEIHKDLPQLNVLDDWMQEDMAATDTAARAAVRDSDQSIDVLLMMKKNDGSVHFLPWRESGKAVAPDSPPPPEIALQIARQKLKLPAFFSKAWNIEKTIAQLEDSNRKFLPQWQLSPMLRGELVLLLDETMSARLADVMICYDKDVGLIYRKDEADAGERV